MILAFEHPVAAICSVQSLHTAKVWNMAASHAPHEIPVQHESADSWHHHDLSAEGLPQREHASIANPFALFATFLGLSVVTAGLVGIVQIYYYQQVTNVGGVSQTQDKEALLRIAADAQAYSQESERSLSNYEWVNAETATVSIPLDTAMDRIIQKYGSSESKPGK